MADREQGATGHRDRLRQRLFEGGPDALLDHEIVEYLLGLFIRRQDTKPLARRLIDEFGGFGALLSADAAAIKRAGISSDSAVGAIKIVHAATLRLLESRFRDAPVLSSWQALLDYLRGDMAYLPIERVRILYLDSKNKLIRNEALSDGSVDEAAVYVREVVSRALEHRATALILVHNHPSGDPSPSQQDIRLTREVIEACRPLRIAVHDHVIVGANGVGGHCSLRAMGLI